MINSIFLKKKKKLIRKYEFNLTQEKWVFITYFYNEIIIYNKNRLILTENRLYEISHPENGVIISKIMKTLIKPPRACLSI